MTYKDGPRTEKVNHYRDPPSSGMKCYHLYSFNIESESSDFKQEVTSQLYLLPPLPAFQRRNLEFLTYFSTYISEQK